MITAALWGLLAASSLLVGAFLATRFTVRKRVLGLIMAFGVGVLISAVAFELIEEAFETYAASGGGWTVAAGLLAGAFAFFIGDSIIDRFGGGNRKNSSARHDKNSGKAILLGSVLDGIPESIVIGLSLVGSGTISAAMVVAVFLSNLPEAIAASTGLRASGWKNGKIIGLWAVVAIVSALSTLAGYTLFDTAAPGTIAFIMAFAGGALLTMLADTMMPEAYKDSGKLVGIVTTLGFGLAYAISVLD